MLNFSKKKKYLNKAKEIIKVLDENLLNQDLYEYAIANINEGIDNKSLGLKVTDNSLSWKEKDNSCEFDIILYPSLIDIEYLEINAKYWHGNAQDTKEIEFTDEDTIVITESNHKTIKSQNPNEISSYNKKTRKRIYINNQPVYELNSEFRTDGNITGDNWYSTERLMYAFEDGRAFEREMVISLIDEGGNTEVRYSKTDNHDLVNYDTRVNNKTVYMYGMGNATEEEFNEAKDKFTDKTKTLIKE